ncbi:MAG: HD domain-containing protein, partial [Firmicutes bacterium]|nr:HD domain-containing protein [Bacillota bacterium]
MHDIGMVKVPVEILRAPRSLTSQEFERVKLHTTLGYRIMTENKEFGYLAAHAALEHHERVHPHEAIRYLGASAGRFDQRLVRRLALRMASYPNGTFV